jgi:membrane protease YdiL (CAAX protease family)
MNNFKFGEKHNFWRYGFLTIMVIGAMVIFQVLLVGVASIIEGDLDIFSYAPINLLWVSMLPFGGALLVLLLGMTYVHHIPMRNIFSGGLKFRWRLFFYSAAIWLLLAVISDFILSLLQPGNYQWSFNPGAFIPYMSLAVVLIAIQITAEEVFFRGYMLMGISRLVRRKWIAILFQALLFGLLHGANTEVTTYGLLTTMPFYIGIGILFGGITHKFKGLEPAMGLHFVNNIYATAFVTFSGSSIVSPAIFTIKDYKAGVSLLVFFITAIVYILLMQVFFKNNKDQIKSLV